MTEPPTHAREPAFDDEIPAPDLPAAPPGAASLTSPAAPSGASDLAPETGTAPTANKSRSQAMVLGMLAFGLGIGLTVIAYFWAMTKVHDHGWEISGTTNGFSIAPYSGWGTHQLIFVGFLLLVTFAGWLIAGLGAKLFSGGAAARSHGPGMAIGAVVFALGVGLVVLVFLTATTYFSAAGSQVPAPAASGPAPDYIGWALNGIVRLLILALMALNGALVAGRGAQMFLGTIGRV